MFHFNDCTIQHTKNLTPSIAPDRKIYSSICQGGNTFTGSSQAADTTLVSDVGCVQQSCKVETIRKVQQPNNFNREAGQTTENY
jgi:hypothetical protein